jgi:uncharacterized phiE125 gp8 family phage protein
MAEPVTLSEAKLYMRIDDDYTYDDAVINTIITAQRVAMERELALSLIEKTGLTFNYRRPCCGVYYRSLTSIPNGPVTSIVIKNTAGDVVTPENLGAEAFPAYCFTYSADVTYSAGYTASNVPTDIKLALLMRVATSYKNREDSTNEQVNTVINASRKLSRQESRNIF